jgi:hypothetical protein
MFSTQLAVPCWIEHYFSSLNDIVPNTSEANKHLATSICERPRGDGTARVAESA